MTNAERILAALLAYGPMSDAELRRQTGVEPHQQVNQICRRLTQEGRVRREPGPGGVILNRLLEEPASYTAPSRSSPPVVDARSDADPVAVRPVAPWFDRTLILLPCSGAKASGGQSVREGPTVCDYLDEGLGVALLSARSRLAPVAAVDERQLLPARQRYTGALYRSAARVLADEHARRNIVILSGGYGLVLANERIGTYDHRFATADWPRGLLEQSLLALAAGLAVDRVVALCARSTGYAELVRRVPWRRAGIDVVLVSPEMRGRGGAQVLVPRAAGEALVALAQGALGPAWRSTDGIGTGIERLT